LAIASAILPRLVTYPDLLQAQNFSMKNAIPYVCSLLLSAPLVAQTTSYSFKTLRPVGVYAAQGSQVDFQSVAANTAIAPGALRSVSAAANNSHATTLMGWAVRKGGIVTADVSEQGGVEVGPNEPAAAVGTTAAPGSSYVQGPHAVLLSMRGLPGSTAVIEVWATGGLNSASSGVRGGYVLDVGNDGTSEFTANLIGHAADAFPVRFPTSGVLSIKLQSEAQAVQSGRGSVLYKSGMSVRLTPGPAALAINYGETCGPRLGAKIGRSTTGSYQVKVGYTGATADGRNLLILGDRRVSVQIPGVRCPLLTRPLVVVAFQADGRGDASWQFTVPLIPDINVQIQGCDLAAAKASNGVHIITVR